jgi:predicted NUDIX family NTP pyrophosphohydrolase
MQAIREAPDGARLTIKTARRSTDQNARMWAMLTDVAMQLEWHGQKLSTNDWKLLFLDLLRREMRLVPNLDKTGWVNLGRSSSDLSKSEMGDLMELIAAFGAQHGVTFRDEAA